MTINDHVMTQCKIPDLHKIYHNQAIYLCSERFEKNLKNDGKG